MNLDDWREICGHYERPPDRQETKPTAQELIERFGPCDHPNADKGDDGELYCGHCGSMLPAEHFNSGHKA